MIRRLHKAQSTVGALLVFIASTIAAPAASVVLFDGTFSDVTIAPFSVIPGSTITGSVCASCGNGGGAGLQTNFSTTSNSFTAASILFTDNALSYDPSSQGALSFLNVALDKRVSVAGTTSTPQTVNNNHLTPFIVQAGTLYVADILTSASNPFPYPGTSAYDTISASGLTASDFFKADLTPGSPDFAGGLMVFGVYEHIGGVPNNTFTVTVDMDNLTFTLVQQSSATPLPTALPLFTTGLGALGLLGWRRKKKAASPVA